ncbi:hypothetical protein R4Z10_06095 [Niallia sp. XMNu-256]|uniref:hypothetical protein n=1 Tax=Niallia sp. XMNu-256 TaxID=3082444 RepID=UPI0030D58F13
MQIFYLNDPLVLNRDIIAIPYVDHKKNYSKTYLLSVLSNSNHLPLVMKEFMQ